MSLHPKEVGLALLYSSKDNMNDGDLASAVYSSRSDSLTNPLLVKQWVQRATMERVDGVLAVLGPAAVTMRRSPRDAMSPAVMAIDARRPDILARLLALLPARASVDPSAAARVVQDILAAVAALVLDPAPTKKGDPAMGMAYLRALLPYLHFLPQAGRGQGQGGALEAGAVEAGPPQLEDEVERLFVAGLPVASVASASPAVQLAAVTGMRQLLATANAPPIDHVISEGWLSFLVCCLAEDRDGEPRLQMEAGWALTNVAGGTSAHTKAVVDAGAVPLLVRLLARPTGEEATAGVVEQAVWALGNIAGDSPQHRNIVLQHGAMQPILALVKPSLCTPLNILRNATWTVSNLCRGKPPPDFRIVGHALPALAGVIHANDQNVLCDGLWALAHLSDGQDDRLAAVLEAGVIPRVVELMAHPAVEVVTPALRVVANGVTGNDLQAQEVLNAGALPHLHRLMSHEKKAIRKEACHAVSNIMAGTQPQIQQVLEEGCIKEAVVILRRNTVGETGVRKEATWAICNGTSCGNANQIALMVEQGVIPMLAKQLQAHDRRLAGVIVEGVENILRAGMRDVNSAAVSNPNPYVGLMEAAGVPEALQALAEDGVVHMMAEVGDRISGILATYFDETGSEEEAGDKPGEGQEETAVLDFGAGFGGFGGRQGPASGAAPPGGLGTAPPLSGWAEPGPSGSQR